MYEYYNFDFKYYDVVANVSYFFIESSLFLFRSLYLKKKKNSLAFWVT